MSFRKIRFKYLGLLVLGGTVLVTSWIAYDDFATRRADLAEKVLGNLILDSMEFKNATAEEAVNQIAVKVRLLGYPGLRVRFYHDAREVPGFHRRKKDAPFPVAPGKPVTIHVVACPLHEALKWVGGITNTTCAIRGQTLIVVPGSGTAQPYRTKTFRLYPDLFLSVAPTNIAFLKNDVNGTEFEGTSVVLNPQRSTVEVTGPGEMIDAVENVFFGSVRPPLWEELKYEVVHWEKYPRDY